MVQKASMTNKIRVGIVDTGIQNPDHPAIKGKIVAGCNFSLDRKKKNDISSTTYHGMAVASVITRTCPDVELVIAKVLNYWGEGTPNTTANGIIYCVNQGCEIINCSVAGPPSKKLEEAVKYANDRGVIVVAASGNDGKATKYYPACYPDVVTVGAMDNNGERADFSTHNEFVDTLAPGVDIEVAFRDGTINDTGTSFSAPYITGKISLLIKKEE